MSSRSGAGGRLGLSGRTQAYLAKAEKAAGGASRGPIMVEDAETGEPLALNDTPAVVAGAAPDHARRPGAPFLPADLLPALTTDQQRDKTVVLRLIRRHQAAQLAELIRREAAREALRRDLLAAEGADWRRKVMKAAFMEERLAAADEIKKLKLDQELALAAKLKEFGMLK
jgi:hypothetical protein